MLRPLRITLEIIASLVGIVILLGLFLAWRLSQGPLQSSFLTPYLERGIETLAPGTTATIDHSLLAWDDMDHSIALHADNVEVHDRYGNTIAAIPQLDVQLSLIGMMFGQFLPTALTVTHPQMQLQRHADGSFVFGNKAVLTPSAPDTTKDDDDTLKENVSRIADHLLHAFFTHQLQISHAVFSIHDIATNSDWSVRIPEIGLDRSGRELTGHAMVDVAQKDKTSTVEMHYAYDREKNLHRLVTQFKDITPAFFAGGHPATLGIGQAAILNLPLTGEIELALDEDMDVVSSTLDLHGGAGTLNDLALWDEPRAVKSLELKADYDQEKSVFHIPSAVIDFGGPRLSVQAAGKPKSALQKTLVGFFREIMNINLAVQLDNWPMDQYGQLWPKTIIPDVREWIAANISKGTFNHGEAELKATLDPSHLDNINFTEGKGKITASGARVQYVDGMPAVEDVSAEALFDLNHLTAQILGGGLGDIKIVPFTLSITGFEDDIQNISIPLKVTGPIPSILSLIDRPPLGYAKAVGLSPKDVAGQADAEVTFHFPLLKTLTMNDIGVVASANLSQVASSKLVPGVNATQGSLALNLTDEGFTIKGPLTLNAVPFQVAWQQSFKESENKPLKQADVTGTMGADQWHSLGIDAFNGTHGLMAVSFQMTQPTKTKTLFSGTLDMTAADIRVDAINWKKPAQTAAIMRFAAERQNDLIKITSIDLDGPQTNVKGKATLTDDNVLTSLTLNPMIIGRTHASLHFSRLDEDDRNHGDTLHFDVSGEAFDISGLQNGKEGDNAKPQSKEFSIKVGKLFTGENGFITQAEGYAIRDQQGWSEINLHGFADGTQPLAIELKDNKGGGRSFDLTCDDFGAALKGLGLSDKVRGGNVDIHGESEAENPRLIVGDFTVGSFTVGNLPMLAVLMNAASPFGFKGLFTDSMDFKHINGKLSWEGDTIKLKDVHAAGASVGINIAGKLDTGSNEANLHGTMVPFQVMNSILNSIPVIGNLLTGGDNQGFFAVSYKINGPMDNPQISVNPISLLTPGFLRNVFFGSSSDDDDETPP